MMTALREIFSIREAELPPGTPAIFEKLDQAYSIEDHEDCHDHVFSWIGFKRADPMSAKIIEKITSGRFGKSEGDEIVVEEIGDVSRVIGAVRRDSMAFHDQLEFWDSSGGWDIDPWDYDEMQKGEARCLT